MFTKESLQRLRERVDLIETLSGYVELKKAGATYKGLCPFHEEKTPSFVVGKGDTHYHCFGCGAHGDSIGFLMNYLHVSFREAVETLAEKFHVILQEEQKQEEKGTPREQLKEALERASEFYQSILLQAEEGREALNYLFKRGFSLDFIRRFQLGFAPDGGGYFMKHMKDKNIDIQSLRESGLLNASDREFFRERITFPIYNPRGSLVGFSARKIKEETFGGKYINTGETKLFKKSNLLYGLNYCRRNIAKQRRAIVVEGQIDCLRLIDAGFETSVAALGTAFGAGHVRELVTLGTLEVILLFDGDNAGHAALSKVGDLFQKVGIEVKIAIMPQGLDPDTYLRQKGKEALQALLEKTIDYLSFQIRYVAKDLPDSPAGKNALIAQISKQIKEWDQPVMVYESLKRLAYLTRVPEQMVGQVGRPPVQKRERFQIDPDRILELDLLRWLVLMDREDFFTTAKHYLGLAHFNVPACKQIYQALLDGARDLLALAPEIEDEQIVREILDKKINRERAEQQFIETVQKLVDRFCLDQRAQVKEKIDQGNHDDDTMIELLKEFDHLGKKRPKVEVHNAASCSS